MNSTKVPPPSLMACFAVMLTAFLPADASAQIHQVKEMNTEQIRALPRDKTVVLLTGGILEQHGPYLPSYTDGYRSECRPSPTPSSSGRGGRC